MRAVLGVLFVCALAVPVAAQGVTAKFQTTPAGGPYAPRNVVAVWIEDSGGNFVKTIGRWAGQRKQYLLQWTAKAGPNDADAITSATRGDHLNFIQATWNLQNKQNVVVPDGTYTIRMELADSDGGTTNEGTFTFVKSASPQVQTNLSNGGFINATISYAAAAACGNNVVDPGETCDGNCPTSCVESGDVCAPNVLVGAVPTCTAQCQVQLVTACHDGDGCCPQGCTAATDNDCGPNGGSAGGGSGNADNTVVGGCATAPGDSGALVLFGAGVVVMMTRRKRL